MLFGSLPNTNNGNIASRKLRLQNMQIFIALASSRHQPKVSSTGPNCVTDAGKLSKLVRNNIDP